MYIDRDIVQGDMVNKYYVFKEELKALCCSKIFKPGEIVLVRVYTSKNRLLVVNKKSELHKVKRSGLNRTTEEYNGDFNKK